MQLTTLNDVFEDQVADLLSAEKQLVEALPDVAAAASSPEFRDAVNEHLEETRGHVTRLQRVVETSGITPPSGECRAMAGLIDEGTEVIHTEGDPIAKDVAIIAGAQRIEHYEIAAYGTARELARQLDHSEAGASAVVMAGPDPRPQPAPDEPNPPAPPHPGPPAPTS